jgi:hypothetical protein
MNAKNCVACRKLIPETFAKCSYCGAAQPVVSAPQAKARRCQTCTREYSAKLAECPFCARGMSVPPIQARSSGASGGGPTSLGPAPEPEENHLTGSIVLFGAPLAVGAVCGGFLWSQTNRLGDAGVFGLAGPSVIVGVLLAPLIGLAFIRRVHGPLGQAQDDLGLPKLAGQIAGVAAIALLPAVLTISAALSWYNRMGASDQELRCTVTSAFHDASKNADWHIAFTCVAPGDPGSVPGVVDGPNPLELADGSTFRLRAELGRLGWWRRTGEPLVDPGRP